MGISNFEELRQHVGHEIQCVLYGDMSVLKPQECDAWNVALECIDCNEVLIDYDKEREDG